MVVLVHCIIKFLSAVFVETQQHGNHILFFLLFNFCLGSTCPEPVYKPLTVCFEFPDQYYFVLIFCGMQHLSIHDFPDGSAEYGCRSNCDSDAAERVVLRELYSL
jgi:hypothetical protein